MKKSILTFFSIFLFTALFAQTGSITNVQVEQRSDGSGLVDIYFDLNGQEDDYYLKLWVSFDAGVNYWAVNKSFLTGDTGPVSPGSSKHIVWDPTQQYPNMYSPETKLKIIAYIQEIMNPCPGTPTVTDYDGNTYHTVLIGNQCWMAENLNTTRDANGNNITRYCYNNDNSWCELYGGLYTWNTVMNGAASSNGNPSGVQGICPNGWHVPSDAEWTELTDFLINTYVYVNTDNVGDKLKSCRQEGSPLGGDCNTSDHPRWDSNSSHHGTNDFGFSALPGGYYSGSSYGNLGSYGHWWSSTQYSSTDAWGREMYYVNGYVGRYSYYKTFGFSVRCLRD